MQFRTLLLLLALLPLTSVPAQIDQPSSFGKGTRVYNHDRQFVETVTKALNEDLYPFYHGVASGDPLEDRVIIWTRVTPDSLEAEASVEVAWRMATDPELENIVADGTFMTNAERDYTVKVDVTGLSSGTTYYYGFTALDRNSLTGKTKTTPTADEADHLKFGVVSCSNYQAGYFNAYGRLADRTDLDAIVHLGDYIYEYENFFYGDSSIWDQRLVEPSTEIISLFDYRARYSTYRLDSNLIRAHQQHPFVSVWDDHESANDAYEDGAQNHTPGEEGDWEDRKAISRRVYFEWMPIRDNDNRSIYRTLSYGNIADLIMIDTRLEGRDQQLRDVQDINLLDSTRTILGQTQKEWFLNQLGGSQAKWKIIGNQVIFSEFNVGWAGAGLGQSFEATESLFLDIWDGYPSERRQITTFLKEQGIENVVFLTGDFHSSFAYEVADPPVVLTFQEFPVVGTLPVYSVDTTAYNPSTGAGAVAVEFATPSITAANFDENVDPASAAGLQFQINNPIVAGGIDLGNPNPHMKYAELIQHGYYVLDVRPDSVQADYFYGDIMAPTSEEAFAAGFFNAADTVHLMQRATPAMAKAEQDVPAPADPPQLSTSVVNASDLKVLAISPNPTRSELNVQYALQTTGNVSIDLIDGSGRNIRMLQQTTQQPTGLYTLNARIDDLPKGLYYLRITTRGGVSVQPVVKQ